LYTLRNIGIGLVAILPALGGCVEWFGPPGGVRMWAAPDSAILLPQTPPELENEVYSSTASSIRLEAAVNEVVSFQVAFRGESGSPRVVNVSVTDLQQQDRRIPAADCVRIYRQKRLPVHEYPSWFLRLTPDLREYREYPDILVPLTAPRGALPIELPIGACEAVWIDITVPPGTEPGIYRSKVQTTYGFNRGDSVDLVLTVHPFSLPTTQHLALIAGVDGNSVLRHHLEVQGRPYAPRRLAADDPAYDSAVRILDATIRLLHEHRCSAMLTDVQPLRKLDLAGKLELDWTDYDRLVAAVLDGTAFDDRIPALAWPMPVDHREPAPELYGGWGSAAYGEMLVEYMRQCVEHFRERGWLDRHFVWIPLPEPRPTASPYSQFAWLGSIMQRAETRLSLVCDLAPQSMQPFGCLDDRFQDVSQYVRIWAPPASLSDADVFKAAQDSGRRTWLQPDRPPYSGSLSYIAPAVHARSLAWQCYRTGCDAIFLPRTTDWQADGSCPEPASPRALIWPGKAYGLDGPVPSIRLKRLMRGLQDYEYLWLLRQNQRPAVADLIAADLFAFGGTGCFGEHCLDSRANGWVHDPAAWSLARSLMARELVSAIEWAEQQASGQPGSASMEGPGSVDFAHQLEWRRHVEGVRRVHTCVEGVRLRLQPERPERPILVRATVSLFNATRDAYNATLHADQLPQGWQTGREPAPVADLMPGRTVLRHIEAFASSIPCNVDGVANLNYRSLPAEGEPVDIPARLCAITAPRLTAPVVMDGALNEWPLATNNAAGDFVLVGALDVPKANRASPDRPSQGTIVFAGRDNDYLYLAFNCQDTRMADRIITQSNRVQYDDLWPAGEDLIEIVMDPTGEAVVPQDLLHVAVKANGAVITERGAACLARIGGHGDWSGEVVAAIDDRSQPDRWTAEIRIPLRSLGKLAPTWGINFARFNARLGEYSSWSAARRYLYSPASLGNIQLAP